MTNSAFITILEQQLAFCKTLLDQKNEEYTLKNSDRLHYFKTAAALQKCSPKEALAGMMVKHTISIYDMCKGGEYPLDRWEEKITDHINYLLLLKGLVLEEIEEKNHAII